jgi:KaiC/GvpD/RAD55 family RecA-like ATPase
VEVPSEVSKAQLYVDQKAWTWRLASSNQLNLQTCPLPDCGNTNWKFFMNRENGRWDCKVCSSDGNLYDLMKTLGDRMENLSSMQDLARTRQTPEQLPDIDRLHQALLDNDEAMLYLMNERGWSHETITKLKLGFDYFSDKPWVVYPYIQKDTLLFAKWRTLPPAAKDFRAVTGRDNPLYNDDAIVKDMEELFIVEGEADAITLINAGITNVIGVPGSSMKKAAWITKLDNAAPKKMYLLYDNDRPGQDGARAFATRFGIERFHNIVLPPFKTKSGADGKDISEWLISGHTVEELATLTALAIPFDVPGVQSASDVLDELKRSVEESGTMIPQYTSPWPSFNKKFGGANRGMVIGIEAEAKVGKTTFAMNWAWWLAQTLGEVALIDCLEMANREMVKKFVSHVAQVDLTPYTGDDEADKIEFDKKQTAEFVAGIDFTKDQMLTSNGDILFAHKQPESIDEAFDTIRNAVRRYGCSVVVFDNLQLLADTTLKNLGHRTAHISAISKRFVALAKELNILVLLIIQPKRVGEGEMVGARHAEGSSAIEKDVDAMVCLHRQREGKVRASDLDAIDNLDVAQNFSPKMFARLDLTRYGPGGACTLWMDGGRSTVTELDAERVKLPGPPATQGLSVPTEQPQFQEA